MRILFLSRWFPAPPNNGSKIRIFNLLGQLAREHDVALVSFADHEPTPESLALLRQSCTDVHAVPYRAFQPSRLTAVTGLFLPQPRSVIDTYSHAMARQVQSLTANFVPDLAVASQVDMAPYALLVPRAKRIWEEVELSVLHDAVGRADKPSTRFRRYLTWWKHARYVAHTLREFDGCTVVSEQESQLLKQISHVPISLAVVPNGVDLTYYAGSFGAPEPNTLVYSGALTYHANLDAMHYFVAEILPLVLHAKPDVRLFITGSTEGISRAELPTHPAITYTGYVPDIRPVVAGKSVSVVPLRVGGGTRLKILESLALGTPVVTTCKGLEGLKIDDGEGVLVADTPDTFAAAILRLMTEPDLHHTLCAAGVVAVQQYDWRLVGDGLLQFIDRIAAPHGSQAKGGGGMAGEGVHHAT